jgi:hypothetical protein
MNTIDAMKQALEALELHGKQYPHMVKGYCLDAIESLEQAIKQESKPQPWSKQWTDAQHERAYRNSPELHKDLKSLAAFKRVAKEIAAMYGIPEGKA